MNGDKKRLGVAGVHAWQMKQHGCKRTNNIRNFAASETRMSSHIVHASGAVLGATVHNKLPGQHRGQSKASRSMLSAQLRSIVPVAPPVY
eukprot:SAG31_NODE_26_length_32985_cov_39.054096_6_plen_90_part_00